MKEKTKCREFECLMYNIVLLRKHHGISKKKMAEMLGISVNSLNKIEEGIFPKNLSVNILFNINKQFHISPAVLIEQELKF